ncbi:MAG: nitrogen regulation protein NR(II) [Halioglobus sp.]
MQHNQLEIIDSISTGVIALDADLQVLAINAAGQAMLELSEARSMRLHASELVADSGEWISTLVQAQEGGSPVARRSVALLLLSGHEIHVDLIATPNPDMHSASTLVVELQAVDRLLRISREEGRLNAQETTRAVVRGLAHEIKNPLGGVRGAAQLLARELPDPRLAEYTEVIIREADRLRDLVDQLLGPNQNPKMATINIHEVIEHVRNLIVAETDNRITIVRDYDPSLPELPGDRSQLIQAILNIMRNALQAAPDLDACQITLRTRSQRQFTVGAKRHRIICRVDIIDNGGGIPEELLHAIFVPMVTGRADGTGLGLSISQSIVDQHGGQIMCSSTAGRTRFSIYLPMESQNAQSH